MRQFVAPLILLAAAPALAFDYRALGGVDVFYASDPENIELGIGLRAEARDVGVHKTWDFRLEFRGREAFSGNATLSELWELNATAKNLGGRVDITVGRLRTPGGFWLVADGAMLTVRYNGWLGQSFYGGLRAFTTGRRNTWMGPDDPVALGIAGTSLWARHRIVQASLSFTWAQDAVDLQSQLLGRTVGLERHVENEYFLDAQATLFPSKQTFLSGGVTFGTRYDVQFASSGPPTAAPMTVGVATLGAFGGFALAEYRPVAPLRLQYSFNFERVRLIQSTLLTKKADGTPVEAAGGSFQDHTLRIVYRVWHALRLDAQYRLRFRENNDVEHHVVVGARGDDLWRGVGAFASVGVDVDTLTGKVHDRVLYSGGLSFVRNFLDLRAGVLFTDGIGSGLLFGQRLTTENGRAPVDLFPYVMESNRIAFLRAFATFWKMYAGADFEANLEDTQFRVLVQVGAAL
jgi:hypothetical protein